MILKTISIILIPVSLVASVYHLFAVWARPESLVVYSRAGIPFGAYEPGRLFWEQGGILLLFPYTFGFATILLVANSLFTIICYVINKDLRGGTIEFLFLQIPVFLFWAGYPYRL